MSYQWSKEVSALLRIRRRALRLIEDWRQIGGESTPAVDPQRLSRDWLDVLKDFNSLNSFKITDDPVGSVFDRIGDILTGASSVDGNPNSCNQQHLTTCRGIADTCDKCYNGTVDINDASCNDCR